MATLFLTGATGYIGGSIAAGLVAGGQRVRGLVRSAAGAEDWPHAIARPHGPTSTTTAPPSSPTAMADRRALSGFVPCPLRAS